MLQLSSTLHSDLEATSATTTTRPTSCICKSYLLVSAASTGEGGVRYAQTVWSACYTSSPNVIQSFLNHVGLLFWGKQLEQPSSSPSDQLIISHLFSVSLFMRSPDTMQTETFCTALVPTTTAVINCEVAKALHRT